MPKIRLRHAESEIELDGTEEFVERQLKAFYERLSALGGGPPRATLKDRLLEKPRRAGEGKLTPAEFYRSKAKDKPDGVTKILIFAKYLEEYRGVSLFSRGEINTLTSEAKLSKDVHAQYFTNAVKQGLLRKQGRKYSLTLSAEEVLAAM